MKMIRFTAFAFLPFILFILTACVKMSDDVVEPLTTGTVTEVDGNIYGTVKIGSQWWMTENLKVTSFKDGSKLREVLSTDNDSIWAKLDSAAFCKTDAASSASAFIRVELASADAIIASHCRADASAICLCISSCRLSSEDLAASEAAF